MSVYDLKPKFQNLLRPICRALARGGVTANQITVLAMVLSLLVGGLILKFSAVSWILLLVPVFLFVRMALNAIDGMLAREHDMQTPLGAILNELGDVVSDCAIYLPLAIIPSISATLITGVVILSIISEMAGVLAFQVGASRRYEGPMGKSDRALVFGILAFLIGVGISGELWVSGLLILVIVLLHLTIYNRVKKALEEIQ